MEVGLYRTMPSDMESDYVNEVHGTAVIKSIGNTCYLAAQYLTGIILKTAIHHHTILSHRFLSYGKSASNSFTSLHFPALYTTTLFLVFFGFRKTF